MRDKFLIEFEEPEDWVARMRGDMTQFRLERLKRLFPLAKIFLIAEDKDYNEVSTERKPAGS